MRRSVEERAYLKALDEEIKRTVIECATELDFNMGFLELAAARLNISYDRLSRSLNRHAHLKRWWAAFKDDVRKKRQRRRAARYQQNRALRAR